MIRYIRFLLAGMVGIFVIWPWVIGVVDLSVWLIGWDTPTIIPWTFARALIALCWPLVTVAVLGLTIQAYEDLK